LLLWITTSATRISVIAASLQKQFLGYNTDGLGERARALHRCAAAWTAAGLDLKLVREARRSLFSLSLHKFSFETH
jgi:hypothetical protein